MFNVKHLKKQDLIVVASELGLEVKTDDKLADIKKKIELCEQFKNDFEFVKEFLNSTVEERLAQEKQSLEITKNEQLRVNREQQAAIEIEKLRLESLKTQLELAKLKNDGAGDGFVLNGSPLDSLIKSIRTLTISVPAPTKPEMWNLFFASLEKAFEIKNVEEELKVEILFNLLGDRAAHLLVYAKTEEMKCYQTVKTLILKEFQPSAESILEGFLSAKRMKNENHMQFSSRLRANWDFYCELKKVSDFESLKELIVSDRLLSALDSETRSYVKIKQLDD